MKNESPFYIAFQVLKVLLMNICQVKPSDLFLFVFISFYTADIFFQKYLLFHSALSKKKYFCHKFSIFNKFTHPPPFSPPSPPLPPLSSPTIATTTTLHQKLASKKKYVAGLEGIFFCYF